MKERENWDKVDKVDKDKDKEDKEEGELMKERENWDKVLCATAGIPITPNALPGFHQNHLVCNLLSSCCIHFHLLRPYLTLLRPYLTFLRPCLALLRHLL